MAEENKPMVPPSAETYESIAEAPDLLKENYVRNLKDLKLCEKNNVSLAEAYSRCSDENPTPLQFWQKPGFLVGEFVVSFSVGVIFVATKCMGMCP